MLVGLDRAKMIGTSLKLQKYTECNSYVDIMKVNSTDNAALALLI